MMRNTLFSQEASKPRGPSKTKADKEKDKNKPSVSSQNRDKPIATEVDEQVDLVSDRKSLLQKTDEKTKPADVQKDTTVKKVKDGDKKAGAKKTELIKRTQTRGKAKNEGDLDENNIELKFNTTVRKWQVNIQEIRITNLMSEAQSVFLVFKVGDSYKQVENITETGKKSHGTQGKRGITFVSEMQDNIDRNATRHINLSIHFTHKASYQQMLSENLIIQAWKYNRWSVNNFSGEVSIPLQRIITENVSRSDVVKVKQEGKQKNSLRVLYR